ncbi:MAG: PspA/IM30 family protein [Planctomycetota bacterium]|jgi:phage shock protein A
MSIFDRIRRITKANVNWLLDQAEPAEQELESKIAELEETLLEGRESAASYGATYKRLENEMTQLTGQQDDCVQKAETALKVGDDDAARAALQQKVQFAERIAQMTPGVEKGRKTFEMLRANLIKLQQQLKDAKLKLQDLRTRQRLANAQKSFDEHLQTSTSASPDGAAFDRLEDQVAQTEAEVEIRGEMQAGALNEVELAQKSRDLQVEAELQALKDKLES